MPYDLTHGVESFGSSKEVTPGAPPFPFESCERRSKMCKGGGVGNFFIWAESFLRFKRRNNIRRTQGENIGMH